MIKIIIFLYFYPLLLCLKHVQVLGYYFQNDTQYFEECDKYAVCNVIYDRHWMPDLIEKICTCPKGSVCPTMYANPIDEYALQINSRTQIKFCEPIVSLKKCKTNQLAITMKRIYHLDNLSSGKAILHCLCDEHSYWKFNQSYGDYLDNDKALIEISDDYNCAALRKCEPREFCGYARSDFGFIFHRCSCPFYHKCGYDIEDDDDIEDVVQELFYNGLGYKARCIATEEFY